MESSFEGLFGYQKKAVNKLKSGSILCGGVGTGKTLTSLAFYKENYGNRPLFVITTAKKRNTGDWEEEAEMLGINELTVDSWNNIKKYQTVSNAFFIFDEQRVVGWGAWSQAFVKIAKTNKWILLTGTPGDTWMDFIPVFVANGFYRNKTDFINQHVEYDRFVKYPKVKKYHNQGKLQNFRHQTLVVMKMKRHTKRRRLYLESDYDKDLYLKTTKERWNPYLDEPIQHAGILAQVLRKIVATSDNRIHELAWHVNRLNRVIIFYNYDYELDIIKSVCEFLNKEYKEYNGHRHEELPTGENWVYIVQYTAGAESWNCTETNSIIFYSPNYSYKITEQSEGRIDRLNTPYTHLDYIYLSSDSSIDKAVLKAVSNKKKFNESAWERKLTNA